MLALTSCVALFGSNSLVLSPISPDIAADYGTSVRFVMTAAAAYGFGTAAGALFLARYIDRWGALRVLTWALGLFALALAASSLAPAPLLLTAAQALAGLAAGISLPAIYAHAAQVAAPGRESKTIGFVLTGWTISMVVGVSLSAAIADLLHWRAIFGLLSGLAVVTAAILALGNRSVATLDGALAPSPWKAARIPGVARLLLVCTAFMISFYGVYGYLGDHLQSSLAVSTSAAGLVTLAYGIGFGLAAFFDGALDRFQSARTMPLAYLAVMVAYLAIALASGSYLALLCAVVLWGLLNHFGLNLLIVRLTAIDPAQRGTIMGLNSTVTYLAVFAGTLGFGPVYSAGGLPLAAYLAAGLCAAAALLAAVRRWPHAQPAS
ncbi:MAG: MFS transporter [Kiloniellales bacterium]